MSSLSMLLPNGNPRSANHAYELELFCLEWHIWMQRFTGKVGETNSSEASVQASSTRHFVLPSLDKSHKEQDMHKVKHILTSDSKHGVGVLPTPMKLGGLCQKVYKLGNVGKAGSPTQTNLWNVQ